ncbi:MAG: sulfatase-like hydrolase/transferase [bacterium]|nr:sulfatase-like hydrolase/transferase [bacterium]
MIRRAAVLVIAGVLMAGASCAAAKPNVILIITDDQSWDSLGFMGGKVHTPRLDQMAKDGMWMTDFNVTSTVCSPSRYSFLTGRYAGRCEGERFMREHPLGDQTQVENIGELEPKGWNLAKILQKNGYRTGFVGKSHVIRHDWLEAFEKRDESGALKVYPKNADPRDPKINAMLRSNHKKWCDEIKKYGFDFADGIYGANLRELHNDALFAHNLDWTVSKAMRFMEESKDKPFFLYFSTTLHHGPSPAAHKHSLKADPRMTGEGFVAKGFNVLPSRADVIKRNRKAGFKDNVAHALWLDDGMGAIIDKVKKLGLAENTLIVFTSDHGSYRHGKTTLHEYGMRVPMLFQWTGKIKPGSKYDGIAANIDFAPTVLDICGITPPPEHHMDGVSLKAAVFGDPAPVREVLFGEMGHSRCVKTKKWKYIAIRYPADIQRQIDNGKKFPQFFKNRPMMDLPYLTRNGHLGHYASKVNPHYFEPDQLYNIKTDPAEDKNIYGQKPEILHHMKQELAKALRQFEKRPFGEFTN